MHCIAGGPGRERWWDGSFEGGPANCMYWRTGYLCTVDSGGRRRNWVGWALGSRDRFWKKIGRATDDGAKTWCKGMEWWLDGVRTLIICALAIEKRRLVDDDEVKVGSDGWVGEGKQ